jgi:hypothetical protein
MMKIALTRKWEKMLSSKMQDLISLANFTILLSKKAKRKTMKYKSTKEKVLKVTYNTEFAGANSGRPPRWINCISSLNTGHLSTLICVPCLLEGRLDDSYFYLGLEYQC